MACFDVHAAAQDGVLLVDVQSDLIDILNTRVVVPLMPPDRAPLPARRLNPTLTFRAAPLIFAAQYIAALPGAELGPPLGTLEAERDPIRAALDMLFLGF
jgi:toxin CcdB